jgi:N-acetylglucosamine malate deacetylase 1
MIPRSLRSTFAGLCALLVVVSTAVAQTPTSAPARPLRIIAFGAHPDDCEFRMGGTAIKWAQAGHKVKFVSVTNGDIGHWRSAGGTLAQRRLAEVKEAARRIGIEVEVLDIHDGELLPTLENRKMITRLIREWQADVVLAHRPWDYHPDHRNVGILVQDSAFMVTVPFFCPDVPVLKVNPTFFYFTDKFTKPNPFRADVAVAIDDVFDRKLHMLDALGSQVYEGGALGSEQFEQNSAAADPVRRKEVLRTTWMKRDGDNANRGREMLIKLYGAEAGAKVQQAELFELCEYGQSGGRLSSAGAAPGLSNEELRRLFPFIASATR